MILVQNTKLMITRIVRDMHSYNLYTLVCYHVSILLYETSKIIKDFLQVVNPVIADPSGSLPDKEQEYRFLQADNIPGEAHPHGSFYALPLPSAARKPVIPEKANNRKDPWS